MPGDTLPGGLLAVEIGAICPDEMALYLPSARAIWFADGLVRGGPDGELGFVPDSLMDDPPETKRGLLDHSSVHSASSTSSTCSSPTAAR